jgi:hypothetical protein
MQWFGWKCRGTPEGRLEAYDYWVDWDYYFSHIKPMTDKWFKNSAKEKAPNL